MSQHEPGTSPGAGYVNEALYEALKEIKRKNDESIPLNAEEWALLEDLESGRQAGASYTGWDERNEDIVGDAYYQPEVWTETGITNETADVNYSVTDIATMTTDATSVVSANYNEEAVRDSFVEWARTKGMSKDDFSDYDIQIMFDQGAADDIGIDFNTTDIQEQRKIADMVKNGNMADYWNEARDTSGQAYGNNDNLIETLTASGESPGNAILSEFLDRRHGEESFSGLGAGATRSAQKLSEINQGLLQNKVKQQKGYNVTPSGAPSADAVKKFREEWKANHEQCILLSALEQFANARVKLRKENLDGNFIPYGGRLVPITPTHTQRIINDLLMPSNVNDFASLECPASAYKSFQPKLKILLVKEEEDGDIREYDVLDATKTAAYDLYCTTPSEAEAAKSPGYAKTAAAAYETFVTDSVETKFMGSHQGDSVGNNVNFVSFSYTMDGSNPSTARRDIKATLKFNIWNMDWLAADLWPDSWSRDKPDPVKNKSMRIVDLILYPTLYQNAKGDGKVYKNQYHPNYNRLRVVLYNELVGYTGEKRKELTKLFEESALVLNLALKEHTIAIKKADKGAMSYDLTIEYAGYFETALMAPYADALADKDVLGQRLEREKLLEKAITEKCSIKYIRSIQRKLERAAIAERSQAQKSVVKRLIQRRRMFKVNINREKVYEFIDTMLSLPDDPEEIWGEAGAPDIKQLGAVVVGKEDAQQINNTESSPPESAVGMSDSPMYFFYLGDLLDVVSDSLYVDRIHAPEEMENHTRDEFRKNTEGLNLYFATAAFQYNKTRKIVESVEVEAEGEASPATTQLTTESTGESQQPSPAVFEEQVYGTVQETYLINLADVPISLRFFKKWYEETVIKKDRAFYPIAAFVRDIAERLLTNILSEVCFSPNFGGRSFKLRLMYVDTKKTSLNKKRSDNPFDQYIAQNKGNANANGTLEIKTIEDLPLMKKDGETSSYDYNCYVVIYPQEQNVYNETLYQGSLESHKVNYIPHMQIGRAPLNGMIIGGDFTKTNQTYLREARYFQSGIGGLTQLSNVYDLKTKCYFNTLLYPGQIAWIECKDLVCGGGPAQVGSIAYQTGIGGYHLIKSVTSTYNASTEAWTDMDAVWMSSGAPQDTTRFSTMIGGIEEEKEDDCKGYEEEAEQAAIEQEREHDSRTPTDPPITAP